MFSEFYIYVNSLNLFSPDCKAVSVWSIHRHGNRNPGASDIEEIKEAINIKEKIIASYDAGNSKLCAQVTTYLK